MTPSNSDHGQFVLHSQDGSPAHRLPEEAVVGREQGCDVLLDDHRISRRHALLKTIGDKVWLEDLGSTNGTYLNGVRLIKGSYAKAGDEVRFSTIAFTLQGSGFDPNKTMIRPAVSPQEAPPAQPAAVRQHERRPPAEARAQPRNEDAPQARSPAWMYAAGGFLATALVLAVVLWLAA